MKKILYALCFIAQMICGGENPLCTEETVEEVKKDIFCALEELALKSEKIPFKNVRGRVENIIDIHFETFVSLLNKYERREISKEFAVERLGGLWFCIPKIEECGDLLMLSYPCMSKDGQITYEAYQDLVKR